MRVLSSNVSQDEITEKISALTDYSFDGTVSFEVPCMPNVPDDYSIGLIVGPSGSGKSTLLRDFGLEEDVGWDSGRAIASHFTDANEAQELLGAVGLNSVPSWLKPFHVLSTGEKFRANLARRLKSGAVIDEFTSVVDRNVALSCSFASARYIRRNNLKNVVFATCHYDVIEWLSPDWVYDTHKNKMSIRGLERRPEIKLELIPCSTQAWSIFSEHHYLDQNINRSSRCWLAYWNGESIGFASAIAYPSGTVKNAWRGHRTVILPDYQGLGIGARVSDAVGEIFIKNGNRFFSKTAHPRLGAYRNNSKKWRPTSKNGKARKDYSVKRISKESGYKMRHANRVCYSHEYIG